MKKIKIAIVLMLSMLAFTQTSCDNEPLDDGIVNNDNQDDVDCPTATQNLTDATTAFLSANEDNYTDLCVNYKLAIQSMINACGDPNGSLQQVLNSLGDCTNGENQEEACQLSEMATQQALEMYTNNPSNENCIAYQAALEGQIAICGDSNGNIQTLLDELNCNQSSEGVLKVTAGTLTIDFINRSATLSNGLIVVTGENTEQGADYHIYFEVTENETGVDVMQNFMLTLNGGDYIPNTDGFDDFTNTINISSGGQIEGTFGGLVSRVSDGADLNLSQGEVDLTY